MYSFVPSYIHSFPTRGQLGTGLGTADGTAGRTDPSQPSRSQSNAYTGASSDPVVGPYICPLGRLSGQLGVPTGHLGSWVGRGHVERI